MSNELGRSYRPLPDIDNSFGVGAGPLAFENLSSDRVN
jgi:hypothetical protein